MPQFQNNIKMSTIKSFKKIILHISLRSLIKVVSNIFSTYQKRIEQNLFHNLINIFALPVKSL